MWNVYRWTQAKHAIKCYLLLRWWWWWWWWWWWQHVGSPAEKTKVSCFCDTDFSWGSSWHHSLFHPHHTCFEPIRRQESLLWGGAFGRINGRRVGWAEHKHLLVSLSLSRALTDHLDLTETAMALSLRTAVFISVTLCVLQQGKILLPF